MKSTSSRAALLATVAVVVAGCGSGGASTGSTQAETPLSPAASKACSSITTDSSALDSTTNDYLAQPTSHTTLHSLSMQLTTLGGSLKQLQTSVGGTERTQVEGAVNALQDEQSGVSSLLSTGLNSSSAQAYPEQLFSPQGLSQQLAQVTQVCSPSSS